jgi:hypothetical protein
MNDLSTVRVFRLSPGGIECDGRGLRVGGVALLARDEKGAWAARHGRDLDRDLSWVYGLPIEARAKMVGLATVANALQSGDIAKAQIAALLLRLPEPLRPAAAELGKSGKRSLFRDLVACGLMKADAGWDEDEHPRTGSAPNPGWFAPKPKDSQADAPPKALRSRTKAPRRVPALPAAIALSFPPSSPPAPTRCLPKICLRPL